MPFTIVRNDITRMAVDAIVNSAAPHLLGGGGADGAIHRAAGPELAKACRKLGGCKPGEAKITEGFDLPCRYVIHTVGPVWLGGIRGEEDKLRACYRNALALALQNGLESVAFPLISSGIFGFPRDKALRIAMDEIRDFVLENDLMVYLVVYDPESFRISSKLQQEIRQYIDDRYVEQHSAEPQCMAAEPFPPTAYGPQQADREEVRLFRPFACEALDLWEQEEESYSGEQDVAPSACELFADAAPSNGWMEDTLPYPAVDARIEETVPQMAPSPSEEDHEAKLRRLLSQRDESFTQMLLRKIDESGMTDPECYRRANIDRRLFSKIRNNLHYQPSKQTALAFAVALRLGCAETEQLLRTAGLALSHSSKFDLVVEYFINEGIYDVMQINEALYAFDLPMLGN